MTTQILGIGTTNPGEGIPQMLISEFMTHAHELEEAEARKLRFVYRQSGIEKRHSVIEDFRFTDPSRFTFFPSNESLQPFPSTSARMQVFKEKALDLAKEAITDCLKSSLTFPSEISHIILVSCTGMFAPGLELEIIQQMQLRHNVERYCIHFMGCYAAFNGMKLADKICRSEPDAKVLLVSVELCTLHFQKNYTEDNLLANAIFADGAAAVLLGRGEEGLSIRAYDNYLFPSGEKDMAWSIGDLGFEMRLSKYVPELLQQGLQEISDHLENKYPLSSIYNYSIHPGGRQILQKVEESLKINPQQNRHSHEVLKNFGNMSSATILFVLKRWMEEQESQGPIFAMGFGPGLTLETMLFEK